MSSIKTRKHYVIADMAFSCLWAFFFFVAFVWMAYAWSQSDEKFSYASANIYGAIFFSLLSIGSWVRLRTRVNRSPNAVAISSRFEILGSTFSTVYVRCSFAPFVLSCFLSFSCCLFLLVELRLGCLLLSFSATSTVPKQHYYSPLSVCLSVQVVCLFLPQFPSQFFFNPADPRGIT